MEQVFKKKSIRKAKLSPEELKQLESARSRAAAMIEMLSGVLLLENLTLDDALETHEGEDGIRVDILPTSKNPDTFSVVVSRRLEEDQWDEVEHHNGYGSYEEAKQMFDRIAEDL